MLAISRGRLVTRAELKTALWGQDSYVDYTAGLNYCMAQLRAALDDSAAAPRIVETVPRRGYRLIPLVEDDAPVPAEPIADGPRRLSEWTAAGSSSLRCSY